ncbi:MAG: alpha-amylase [Dysgonomonas sp.]|nr:alpha-amylase [Dysgonomonas sp.]
MKNGVMMQYFEWNLPNEGNLWKKIKEDAAHLHTIGVTSIWIPPAYKASSQEDVGYSTYDLFDLGEFNQKDTVRTKYGTKEELIEMIEELHKHDICVYLDAVLNHKAGADYTEKFLAKEVDPTNREKIIGETHNIEGWTGFNFPGRKGKYSDFEWHYNHFTGTDYDQMTKKKGIFLIEGEGKSWNEGVDDENGNYDYLMFADVDYNHPEVIAEITKWGIWVTKELKLDGMRLDAIKHISNDFIRDFLAAIRKECGDKFYSVGEYWKEDIDSLNAYLEHVDYETDLFDVPLHYSFYEASQKGRDFDMQTLFHNSLVKSRPMQTVTFVENHDSQKGGSLESEVQDWFKPIAYGIILLMKEGYPCVFYGDYYDIKGKKSPHRPILDVLIETRQKYALGEQVYYIDHPNTVGFVRMGDAQHPDSGLALLASNGEDGNKTMNVGKQRKGEIWHEITGSIPDEITIDDDGNGAFWVHGGKLAVWVKK